MITKAKTLLTVGIISAFAVVVAVEESRLASVREDMAELKAKHLSEITKLTMLQRDALISAQEETQRRLTNQRKVIDEHKNTIEKLHADYLSANDVSIRLRQRVEQLTQSSCGSKAINSTTAPSGETESATARIAELARLADETAGKLARELDEAIARGKTCEMLYQNLTKDSHDDRSQRNH